MLNCDILSLNCDTLSLNCDTLSRKNFIEKKNGLFCFWKKILEVVFANVRGLQRCSEISIQAAVFTWHAHITHLRKRSYLWKFVTTRWHGCKESSLWQQQQGLYQGVTGSNTTVNCKITDSTTISICFVTDRSQALCLTYCVTVHR